MPKKTIKVYGNNKPWITSALRKKIVAKHSSHANNHPEHAEKQKDLDDACISRAKLDYKDKVENLFNQINMKDPLKGLKTITGQKKVKKECALLQEVGSAERMNQFYACFDNKDFYVEHQRRKEERLKQVNEHEPIIIQEDEIIRVFNKINTKKATGPDKINKCSCSQDMYTQPIIHCT